MYSDFQYIALFGPIEGKYLVQFLILYVFVMYFYKKYGHPKLDQPIVNNFDAHKARGQKHYQNTYG